MNWKDELIQPALSEETHKHIAEQKAWIAREPANPRPYHHLAQLYRIENKQDEALALLLHAVHLDPTYAPAHAALTEMYAVKGDYKAAWAHARAAQNHGLDTAVELLTKHQIPEP